MSCLLLPQTSDAARKRTSQNTVSATLVCVTGWADNKKANLATQRSNKHFYGELRCCFYSLVIPLLLCWWALYYCYLGHPASSTCFKSCRISSSSLLLVLDQSLWGASEYTFALKLWGMYQSASLMDWAQSFRGATKTELFAVLVKRQKIKLFFFFSVNCVACPHFQQADTFICLLLNCETQRQNNSSETVYLLLYSAFVRRTEREVGAA